MEIPFTEKPSSTLDLAGGEHSLWNRKLTAVLASHVRALSNRASSSGKDEGYDYFMGITTSYLRTFYDAFAVSRPRVISGVLETLDQAWDRFERVYGNGTSNARQSYRLVSVRGTA